MKLCRKRLTQAPRWFVVFETSWRKLPENFSLGHLLSSSNPTEALAKLARDHGELSDSLPGDFLPPLEDQEIWACGVTYFSSRRARMAESKLEGNHYDRVYSATRPQIFPKGRGRNVITQGGPLLLRPDSKWIVPEPELVLVLSSAGKIVGYTLGNDLSCRDIEGENPLYLPQAKIWTSSCVLAGEIELTNDVSSLAALKISMKIARNGEIVFKGEANTSDLIRPLASLADTLFHYRQFPDGAFLFTGTGVIPPDEFSLIPGDCVEIKLGEDFSLTNTAVSMLY